MGVQRKDTIIPTVRRGDALSMRVKVHRDDSVEFITYSCSCGSEGRWTRKDLFSHPNHHTLTRWAQHVRQKHPEFEDVIVKVATVEFEPW